MCRFLMYLMQPIHLSSLVTEPENSLIRQSFASREREEPLNGDGFGIAWYAHDAPPEPALFRSITPAWSNQNLRHLARVVRSGCILAHVRAASTGMAVTELNTHPFVHGRYSFMHNGEIASFHSGRRALMNDLDDDWYPRVEGSTDSEWLFLRALQELESAERPDLEAMARALEGAIADARARIAEAGRPAHATVNAVLTNGREAVITRFADGDGREAPSLHIHTGKLYSCRSGRPELLEAHEDAHAVIVASEPLTGESSWTTVPSNHVVLVDAKRRVTLRLIAGQGGASSAA